MFGRATIALGIGPNSSYILMSPVYHDTQKTVLQEQLLDEMVLMHL